MASILKRHKLSEEEEEEERESKIDRISNLPNSLISHILSFLPTKYAVRTSVLSTNWKRHWKSITNIDIYDMEVYGTGEPSDKMKMSFVNIVYRVMLLCPVVHMDKLHLMCDHDYDISHVNAWVDAAIARNVQEFDLDIPLEGPGFLSRDLFTYGNLVVLKLGTGFHLNVPNSVCLQNLKILHICYMIFSDDESLNRLFLGCPLLEELTMRGSVGKNVGVVKISVPSLKRLIINNLSGEDSEEDVKYKIVFDTPNLLYLECDDCLAKSYSGQKLNHLVKALVYLELEEEHSVKEFIPIYSQAVTDFLEVISKVQVLHVSGQFLQAIDMCSPQLPIFHHATYLEFCINALEWHKLADLLQSMPHLETLVFEEGLVHVSGDDSHWYPPENVPSCLLCCLKVIEIMSFQGNDIELELVEYFLKNARVLKKMTLHHLFTTRGNESKLTKKLLMLPRGSSCQIEFL